jgi:hypothetical protein
MGAGKRAGEEEPNLHHGGTETRRRAGRLGDPKTRNRDNSGRRDEEHFENGLAKSICSWAFGCQDGRFPQSTLGLKVY